MSEENANLSALEENISRKGNNSYYYAHGKKIEGPAWDGKEEPRLLGTSEKVTTSKKLFTSLDSFSWMDGEKNVKVLVDFENADQVNDEDIQATVNESSLEFKFSQNNKSYILSIGPLYGDVESVSYKKKSDKFVVTLKKTEENTWTSLKKNA